MRKQNAIIQYQLAWVIAITIAVLLSARPASAQFIIQPMIMNFAPRPGERIRESLELQNGEPDTSTILDMSLVELGQSDNGTWQFIEPNDPNSADLISRLSSCRTWIGLDKDSVEVGPQRIVPVYVTLKTPPRVGGFYAAAILAKVRRPEDPNIIGWPVHVQFLIPVFSQIQGRVTRHRVMLNDVGLEFHEPTVDSKAATVATMNIANTGGTYSGVKGFLRIRTFRGGHWREVTTAEFKDTGIIPGMDFRLITNIEKSLPAGRYKLEGALYVDGTLTKRYAKDIDFVGDPSAIRVTTDAALVLDPAELILRSRPGNADVGIVTVHNGADEPVNISVAVGIPSSLVGVAYGDVKGDELSCAKWVKVSPERFTLSGNGGRRNIRISAEMPKDGAKHAAYYAVLGVRGTYDDGQSAGVKTAIVSVVNRNIEPMLAAQLAGPMQISALEGSEYLIVAGFSNVGNFHVRPRCTATTTTLQNAPAGSPILLSGKSGLMLPFESRGYSGTLDLSKFLAGTYRVTAILEYAPGQTARSEQIIQVSGPPEGQREVVIR